jgi:UDP-glucose 4-epimerase
VRVVVTGGAGFIGANLCRLLDADPAMDVVAVDNLSTGSRDNLRGLTRVELVEGSILDPKLLGATLSGADAVVHLAARPSVPRSMADPFASHDANATGTVRVLEAARSIGDPLVVVASSSSVYGASPVLPRREDLPTMALSPYAASKVATESYALAYGHAFGLPVLAFRFFNVFGPLQAAGHAYAAVVPAFVSAAISDEAVTVHGDGRQTRDFTFVGTVVEVIADSLRRRVHHVGPVNLAFGSRVNLLELIAELEAVVGHPVRRHHVEPRQGDVRDSQADQTLLRSLFTEVAPVPLHDGLAQTVRWFESGAVGA